jgi:hypothetical protein
MIAGIFVLVLGVGALSASVMLAWRLRRARKYRPVPARVVERSVVGVLSGPGRATFGPKVRYTYQVGGREFVNDRWAYFERGYTRGKAERTAAAVPDEITVYISPNDPSQAVVDRSGTGVAVVVGCLGTLLVLVALLMIAMP